MILFFRLDIEVMGVFFDSGSILSVWWVVLMVGFKLSMFGMG